MILRKQNKYKNKKHGKGNDMYIELHATIETMVELNLLQKTVTNEESVIEVNARELWNF